MFLSLENSSQTGSYSLLSIFLRGKFFFSVFYKRLQCMKESKKLKIKRKPPESNLSMEVNN